MQDALGEPPYLERLKAAVAAPATERELRQHEGVRALVDALKAAGVDPFSKPLLVANRDPELSPDTLAILELPEHADALRRLEAYLRAVHLRKDQKVEPEKLLQLMERFGPIDWRLPEALALYWSAEAVRLFGDDALSSANADRILFHELVSLYRRGRLFFAPPTEDEGPVWVGAPNFTFLERIVELHTEITERHKGAEWQSPTEEGFRNFLRETVVYLYLHQDLKRANKYLKMLFKRGGESKADLDTFVHQRIKKLLDGGITHPQACNLIRGEFFQSLLWESLGEMDRAAGHHDYARRFYKIYEATHGERSKLPEQRQLWLDALRQAFYTFREYQIGQLRLRYPRQIKELEEQRKRIQEAERKRREERRRQEGEERRSGEAPPRPRAATSSKANRP
jgi:hypothetical protein